MKKVVIIFGAPGAGKGTQANLVAGKLGLIHFDTGSFLRNEIYAPENQKKKIIKRERALIEGGHLATSAWVYSIVKNHIVKLSKLGMGIVLSGSPRKLEEAQKLFPVLEKLFGKKNIVVVALGIPESETVRRNKGRLECHVCHTPLMAAKELKHKVCPSCGSKLFKRADDNAKIIKERLATYHEETEPILSLVQQRKIKLVRIDGTPLPGVVFTNIIKEIDPRHAEIY
jgi:adenylate kinase